MPLFFYTPYMTSARILHKQCTYFHIMIQYVSVMKPRSTISHVFTYIHIYLCLCQLYTYISVYASCTHISLSMPDVHIYLCLCQLYTYISVYASCTHISLSMPVVHIYYLFGQLFKRQCRYQRYKSVC